jgi:hypothetical protein
VVEQTSEVMEIDAEELAELYAAQA